MTANFEVTAYKNGKKTVRYYVMQIYSGIAADLAEKFEKLGYRDIQIRMI